MGLVSSLEGVADVPEGCIVIEGDLHRLEDWGERNVNAKACNRRIFQTSTKGFLPKCAQSHPRLWLGEASLPVQLHTTVLKSAAI